jgi:hypothetical protein
MLQVLGEIDGGHSAPTQFDLEPVAVGQCGPEAIGDLGQRMLRERGSLRIFPKPV